jgi:PHP family Zn ribbon phosphoesterase
VWQKKCGKCQKRSYSSAERYEWICPYCGKDLSRIRATPATLSYVPIRPVQPPRKIEEIELTACRTLPER